MNPQDTFTGHDHCTGAGTSGVNGLVPGVTAAEGQLVPWLNVNSQIFSVESVHPNDLGTTLYAQALEDALVAHP